MIIWNNKLVFLHAIYMTYDNIIVHYRRITLFIKK